MAKRINRAIELLEQDQPIYRLKVKSRDLTLLDNVNTQGAGSARIAPGHRIMT